MIGLRRGRGRPVFRSRHHGSFFAAADFTRYITLQQSLTVCCTMEPSLKELSKLEKLAGSSKSKAPSIDDSLDSLLRTLRETKESIQSSTAAPDTFSSLSKKVESTKKDIDDRQKEVYSSLARFGKALDKARYFPRSSRWLLNCAFLLTEVYSAVAVISADVFLAGGRRST